MPPSPSPRSRIPEAFKHVDCAAERSLWRDGARAEVRSIAGALKVQRRKSRAAPIPRAPKSRPSSARRSRPFRNAPTSRSVSPNVLGDGACLRDIACLHLGDWNCCDVCFDEQVSRFFDQAGKFITAVAASAEPGARTLRKAAVADSNSCDAFSDRVASFTEAQQRVFELLITGLPNKLIAYQIGVAEATVKAHVSAVLHKLQVRSRAQAIALSSAFERNCAVGAERGELIRRNGWATMPGSKDTAGKALQIIAPSCS